MAFSPLPYMLPQLPDVRQKHLNPGIGLIPVHLGVDKLLLDAVGLLDQPVELSDHGAAGIDELVV
jgi:hypothetical protein